MRVPAVIAARERFHRGQAALARNLLTRPWGEENQAALEDQVTTEDAKAAILAGVAAWCSRADLFLVLPDLLRWLLGKQPVETPYWGGWDPGPSPHTRKGSGGPRPRRVRALRGRRARRAP